MAKPRMGRPPKPEDEHAVQFSTRWPPGLIERVDALAEARPDQPSRAQVMREAIALGLDALEQRLKGRK
jgi:predicted DNA-binding protein